MMSTLLLSATCRVCLASDREMYHLANTALEETYERVTSGTLVVEGRPCCVCGVCLSALRRCRRFIDTAREANDALDRWIRNHPNTDTLKLTERPLFSFTQSDMNIFEITCQESGIQELGVKQERDTAEIEAFEMIHHQNKGTSDDEGNILKEEIKCEATSDDDNNNTQMSDNIESQNTQVLLNSECINVYDDMVDIFKFHVPGMFDSVKDGTALGALNVKENHESSDEDISFQILRSRKRVRLSEDTKCGPALKKRRPITSEDQHGNTDPAAALHNEGDMFSCRYCNTILKHRFNRHLKIYPGEKPFACDKCSQKRILKQHLLTHTDEKPFACEQCAYKCMRKSHLERHLLTHTGKKPFSCNECDYKCTVKANLQRHLSRHTDEKPFSCNECDYKCSGMARLKEHLLTHTDEKPFACEKCAYKCKKISNLKKHLFKHTDEKPFSCDKCDYKCTAKANLQRHLSRHTGQKQLSCYKCDYKCFFKVHLKKHLNLTHHIYYGIQIP